jgi:hypothetical protein
MYISWATFLRNIAVLCCHLINPINIGRQPVHDMSDAQVVGLAGAGC